MNRNGDEMQVEDERPAPKPRKHATLWQAYLFWLELVEMRKRHNLRITAVERGKSNMDADFERAAMGRLDIDARIDEAKAEMVEFGEQVGPVWEWLTSIKGLGQGGLAAQLLAQIDDVAKFATVSKLWRFCGYAVIDGAIDKPTRGEKLPYNRRLKSIGYLIAEQFIRQQTSVYVDIYYDEKQRQARLHPELTPGHIHNRAIRKMVKIFLQQLWVTWRQSEGLLVTEPYVYAVMGHTNIVTA